MVSELPGNKKELWKYIKDNKLDIKKEQGISVEELQTKIKEGEDRTGKKKAEKKEQKKTADEKVSKTKTVKVGKETVKDTKQAAKVNTKTNGIEKDKYNFLVGSKCSNVMKLIEEGKYTKKNIFEKLSGELKSPGYINCVFNMLCGKGQFVIVKNDEKILTVNKQ